MTRPRRCSNQRLATVAASGTETAPVALPTTTPQSRSSCQGAVITVVSEAPAAIVASATSITRRTPKRSISAAENGADSPYSRRPIEIASEIVPRDQPYSCCSGHDQHARGGPEARGRDQRHEGDDHDQPGVVERPADQAVDHAPAPTSACSSRTSSAVRSPPKPPRAAAPGPGATAAGRPRSRSRAGGAQREQASPAVALVGPGLEQARREQRARSRARASSGPSPAGRRARPARSGPFLVEPGEDRVAVRPQPRRGERPVVVAGDDPARHPQRRADASRRRRREHGRSICT